MKNYKPCQKCRSRSRTRREPMKKRSPTKSGMSIMPKRQTAKCELSSFKCCETTQPARNAGVGC